MQLLPSSLHILCYLCISHLVIQHGFSDEVVIETINICDTSFSSTPQCNLSYPFASQGGVLCPVSDSFRANCSSEQSASWDAFEPATSGVNEDKLLAAPVITGIFRMDNYTYINLAWINYTQLAVEERMDYCDTFSVHDVDGVAPDYIQLTTFADGSLQFSPYSAFLLFNCSNIESASDVEVNSSICSAYQQKCDSMETMSCVQFTPFQKLSLHSTLDTYSCTHFRSLVLAPPNMNSDDVPPTWKSTRTGIVQLVYGDIQCIACLNSGGKCNYSQQTTHHFENCICGANCYDLQPADQCKGAFQCSHGARIGLGVAVAVVAATILSIASLILVAMHSKKKKQGMINLLKYLDLSELTERPEEFRYALIVSATNSFSSKLGEGGFGKVYKGTLPGSDKYSGQGACIEIAVKVLEVRSNHSKAQFVNEVATIGRIHHVHVVRLLGFCVEDNNEMLVYEYVVNGSLDKWLFNRQRKQRHVLDWDQRYKIALGIAKGLSYLHEECRHRIVHCDIKPQNILLDGQMCPKIADFGLARLMGRDESRVVTLHVKGTPGYMAPEFWMGGNSHLSTKSDVYSYGMVLLELMSGRPNFQDCTVAFPAMAFEAAMRGDFQSIMDMQLGRLDMMQAADHHGSETADKVRRRWQIRTCVFVALWCIQDQPMRRPSMSEVVQYVEGVSVVSEQPPRPISASTASPCILSSQTIASRTHRYQDYTPISGR